jgi:hypothetical protein
MRRVLILNVLLLAIVAVLVVQIVALWWGTDAAVEQVAPRKPKSQRALVRNPVRPPAPRDLVANIAGKDLFDAARAAAPNPDAKPVAGTGAPVAPLVMELLGVRIVGGLREALVKEAAQPKALWLRPGEEIGGHTVARIDPRVVVMAAPTGEETTFPLKVKYERDTSVAALGPAGIQPVPPPPQANAQAAQPAQAGQPPQPGQPVVSPAPRRTPSADIKAKIERLREEARKRRAERAARQGGAP